MVKAGARSDVHSPEQVIEQWLSLWGISGRHFVAKRVLIAEEVMHRILAVKQKYCDTFCRARLML